MSETLVIQPGDKLIVRYQKPISAAQLDQWRTQLEALLPGVGVVVITADEIAVYRSGGAP